MERYFWSLMHEWTKHERSDTLTAAKLSAFKYIETIYNTERFRQTLDCQSLTNFEADPGPAQAA